MRLPSIWSFATLLLMLPALPAQVSIGDIALVDAFPSGSNTTFHVLQGGTLTAYVTPGFQGNGEALCVLWDPKHPNDFLIGGDGFVGRATITGPGTCSYVRVTNNVNYVGKMSWDPLTGFVMLFDTQLRLLDPVSGLVITLTSGPQPWGFSNKGAVNPGTGDVVISGDDGALYRFQRASGTAAQIASGIGWSWGLDFDRVTGDIVACPWVAGGVVRVSASATTVLATANAINPAIGLDVDQNGDFITSDPLSSRIVLLPRNGGALVTIGNVLGGCRDLAMARPDGFGMSFGQGCNGAAGPVQLSATGPFRVGGTVVTSSTSHAPNAPGIVIFGLSSLLQGSASLPFLLDPLLGTAGCRLYTSIDATVAAVTVGGPAATMVFPLSITPAFAGHRFFVQHACFEPVVGGLSWSNGLAVRIP